jgi:hypothetical protein
VFVTCGAFSRRGFEGAEKIFLDAVFDPATHFAGRAFRARRLMSRRECIEWGHVVASIERRA